MPFLSERQKILKDIDRIIFYLAIQKSFLNYDDENSVVIHNEIHALMNIKFGILCFRYINQPNPIPKSTEFQELMWMLPDQEFKQEVRMSKESFYHVHCLIEKNPIFSNNSRNAQACVSIQMAVCFHRYGCYGNGASVGRIARSKGISNGAVTLYCQRIAKAILSVTSIYVKWPNHAERLAIAHDLKERYGVPGCVGFVDGTDVVLSQRPHIDGEVFFSRKHKYCLNTQIICDHKRRYLFIDLMK